MNNTGAAVHAIVVFEGGDMRSIGAPVKRPGAVTARRR